MLVAAALGAPLACAYGGEVSEETLLAAAQGEALMATGNANGPSGGLPPGFAPGGGGATQGGDPLDPGNATPSDPNQTPSGTGTTVVNGPTIANGGAAALSGTGGAGPAPQPMSTSTTTRLVPTAPVVEPEPVPEPVMEPVPEPAMDPVMPVDAGAVAEPEPEPAMEPEPSGPVELPNGCLELTDDGTGNFTTGNVGTDAACYEIAAPKGGWFLSSQESRTVTINGEPASPPALPAAIDGKYVVEVSAGEPEYLAFGFWN